MEFIYGTSHFERDRGDIPALPLINMIAEEIPTEGVPSLQSRPGLEESPLGPLTSGPVAALFTVDGALNGQMFAIAGGRAFSGTTDLGVVNGTGSAGIVGYEEYVFFNAGASLYSYNGETYTALAFPDGANISAICVGASRLIAIRKDSGTFYWSDVLDTNIDALSFASAENGPDRLLDLLYVGDTLVLFGSKTIEFWAPSQDQDAPYQPIPGRVLQVGLKQTGAACQVSNSFAWVTDQNKICIGSADNIISTPGLNVKIQNSPSVKLWPFEIDGVEFICVQTSTQSFVYNTQNGLWSEFTSYGGVSWGCSCFANGTFGSAVDNKLLQWSDGHSDLGEELERRFRAWIAINEGTVPLYAVTMKFSPGQTPYLEGALSNPVIELRTSKDGGKTWSPYKARGMGLQGEYRKQVRWNGLGSFGTPGALVELRVTDQVPFRISGLYANQTGGSV